MGWRPPLKYGSWRGRAEDIPSLEDSELIQQALQAEALRRSGPEVTNRSVPQAPWTEEEKAQIKSKNEASLPAAKEHYGLAGNIVGKDASRILRTNFDDHYGTLGLYNPHHSGWADSFRDKDSPEAVRRLELPYDNIAIFPDGDSTPTVAHELAHRNTGADDEWMYPYDMYNQPTKKGWDAEIDANREAAIDNDVEYGVPRAEAVAHHTKERISKDWSGKIKRRYDKIHDWEMKHGANYEKFGYPDYSMVPESYGKQQYKDARDQQSYWARELRKQQ